MAFGFQGCGFRGVLGAVPEIGDGKASLRVAVKMGGEYTEWVSLTAWGKNLDFIARFQKGDTIHVPSAVIQTRYDEAKNAKYINVSCQATDIGWTPKGAGQATGNDKDLPF